MLDSGLLPHFPNSFLVCFPPFRELKNTDLKVYVLWIEENADVIVYENVLLDQTKKNPFVSVTVCF